jgi:hypothetical protein
MLVQEVQASGVDGGTSISGNNIRSLNTLVSSNGSSLVFNSGSNSITINQTGTYRIKASALGCKSDRHQIFIRNVGNNTVLATGVCATAPCCIAGGSIQTTSTLDTYIVVTSSTTIRLEHYILTALSSTGLGLASLSGFPEVYSSLEIQKVN